MPNHTLRIIGGQWRGRKIHFPDAPELRPTPDRIRETLFNWLMHDISGSVCLDLFAGSGALGFEALSRGAKHVVFVDNNRAALQHIQSTCAQLAVGNFSIIQADATQPVALTHLPFDIVFLDPPFRQNYLAACCTWLANNPIIAPKGLIYLEAETRLNPLPIPGQWQINKQKRAGQVAYYLACKQ